jgi:transcriptional regulator of acetoin/glycerol metabolism
MTAAVAVPLITAVGGTLLQTMATNSAAKKQQSIMNAASRRAEEQQRRSRALTMEEAEQFDPTKRAKAQEEVQNQITQSLGTALADNNQSAENTNEGNLSSDFDVGKAKAIAARRREGIDTAQLLARMRAPDMLRLNENIRQGDLASQIGENSSNSQGYFRAGELDAQGVRPNQLMTLIGGAAQAYGVNKALAGMNKPKVPGTTYGKSTIPGTKTGASVFL